MTTPPPPPAPAMRRILWAGAVAFLLKLLLALFTAGTNDALTWRHDLELLNSSGFAELYRAGVQYRSPAGPLCQRQAFIHPPAMLHLLRSLGALQQLSGLPVRFWLRAACALADVAMLLLLLRVRRATESAWVLLALSPISILISGFHANTDPILMFFVVASVLTVERGRPFVAGLAFALACGIKLVPLLYAPALLLGLRSGRSRAQWIAASAAAWIALSSPYILERPALIGKTMLSYHSAAGLWGFSLLPTLLGSAGGLQSLYAASARWMALLAAGTAPLLFRRRLSLFGQCGLLTLVFLFLSPGLGLQYLCWTVPWTVWLEFRWMAAHHAVAGFFLLTVYAVACQGIQAYADLLAPGNFPVLILIGLICWTEIGLLVWRWMRPRGSTQNPGWSPAH